MSVLSVHLVNWWGGWILILGGFLVGALIGLGFHRESFLGGYASFRRRVIRLGHIALVALGMLNILFAVAVPISSPGRVAGYLLMAGAITMPMVCFLSGWRSGFRSIFFIPVTCLIAAITLILIGGLP